MTRTPTTDPPRIPRALLAAWSPGGFVIGVSVLLVAIALTGCQHVAQTNGPETISATSVFTNINVASDCLQMDGDGNILSQTHHTLTTAGDAATLHEAGAIFGSALAFAGKFVPLPVPPPGSRMGVVPSPAGSPAVTSCGGEQTVSTRPQPAPAPVPTAPPAPPLRPAVFAPGEHRGSTGTVRYLELVSGDGTVSYATPGGRRYRVSEAAWLRWAEGEGGA